MKAHTQRRSSESIDDYLKAIYSLGGSEQRCTHTLPADAPMHQHLRDVPAMRLILGLDAPTSGTVRVNGCSYRDLAAPLHEVGAMLEAHAIHTGRSAYNHLLALAQTHGLPRRRVAGGVSGIRGGCGGGL